SGSDDREYPDCEAMLAELPVRRSQGFDAAQIAQIRPDLCVIANGIANDNAEFRFIKENGYPYTSFPKALSELLLRDTFNIVVAGTHGKSTTTAWIGHCLEALGEDPSLFVGALLRENGKTFRAGSS